MAEPVSALARIPLHLIDPGPNARGELVPAIVEPAGDRYMLFDGHRRYAAAKLAGRDHLAAIVRTTRLADDLRIVAQLGVEAQTERFPPMAEAHALHNLMFEHGWTREAIAHSLGKPPAWVRDRISLVHLEPREQNDLDAGRMSAGEALRRIRDRRAIREGREPTPAAKPAPKMSPYQAGIPARSKPAATTTIAASRTCPTCHQPVPPEAS